MGKLVPSLTASGWLAEISEKADALISYYITSEHSQSYLYQGNITSLTYHIQQHGNEPQRLESRMKDDLHIFLTRYFDAVEVEVTTEIPDVDDPNRINITLDVILFDNGFKYSLGRVIRSENKRVVKVFKINNEG